MQILTSQNHFFWDPVPGHQDLGTAGVPKRMQAAVSLTHHWRVPGDLGGLTSLQTSLTEEWLLRGAPPPLNSLLPSDFFLPAPFSKPANRGSLIGVGEAGQGEAGTGDWRSARGSLPRDEWRAPWQRGLRVCCTGRSLTLVWKEHWLKRKCSPASSSPSTWASIMCSCVLSVPCPLRDRGRLGGCGPDWEWVKRKGRAVWWLASGFRMRISWAWSCSPSLWPCALGRASYRVFTLWNGVKMMMKDDSNTYFVVVCGKNETMYGKALSTMPSMKVAKKVLHVIVVFLWRFVLKLLIRFLERQDVDTLKLRNKTRCIARQCCG